MKHRAGSPLTRKLGIALLAFCALLIAAACFYYVSPKRGLPYRDRFAQGRLTEWKQFGGDWITTGDVLENASDERGSKIVTGSAHWKDYVAEADLQLLSRGDSGLILRASDLEEGVDAYRGYYAGLRFDDSALILGRADYGWQEFPAVPVPGGIATQHWYHLTVSVHGCVVRARVTDPATGVTTQNSVSDPGCPASGQFGLRTVLGGGRFKNVAIRTFQPGDEAGESSVREASLALYPTNHGPLNQRYGIVRPSGRSNSADRGTAEVKTLAQLRLLGNSVPVRATVRGVITLTPSSAYIQDATGGAEIWLAPGNFVKSGDDVEVAGDVSLEQLSLKIDHAELRNILGEDSNPALSITPLQAAMGRYDAMFVSVEGTLISSAESAGPVASLLLAGGGQRYQAIASSREPIARMKQLEKGSQLRLRGICLVGKNQTHDQLPFVLLLQSPEDIEVLSGPPWWTGEHLALLAIAMLALGFTVHLLYSHSVEKRREAVIHEREHLSHEIHDTLAQSFAGLDYKIRAIRNRAVRGTGALDMEALRSELTQTAEMIRHSHEEARRSLASLRPEILERLGLADALTRAGRQMTAGTSIAFELHVSGPPRTIPARIADALFRVGQESVANAVRHSHARHIRLHLQYGHSDVQMKVEDDGTGFDQNQDSDGFGLTVMRRRAEKIRATLTVTSTARGTEICVKAPCPRDPYWMAPLKLLKELARRIAPREQA